MTGEQRRKMLLTTLSEATSPVSGTVLGEKLQASRQVIVQDIALLRASGHSIVSTNRGYILQAPSSASRMIKVRHGRADIEAEMNAVVDLGGSVEDVSVNHRTYGIVCAELGIHTRRDVKHFIADLEQGVSSPLSEVTDGYHFHTISAESEEILDEIEEALGDLGFLAELTPYEQETMR